MIGEYDSDDMQREIVREENSRLRKRCAELEAVADQLEVTSEWEVAWFNSMYRMIDALGGKRGMSVPEDVEWAIVEAKRLKERCAELEAEQEAFIDLLTKLRIDAEKACVPEARQHRYQEIVNLLRKAKEAKQ